MTAPSSSSHEKVYIIGGTGNSGRRVVTDLISNGVSVTVYTRSRDKAQSLFGAVASLPGSAQLEIVEGSYVDLTPFEKTIGGHTRLFKCVALHTSEAEGPNISVELAKIAYQAGVKQVVDVSAISVSWPWRVLAMGYMRRAAEEAIVGLPERQKGMRYVALRPFRFMSNIINHDKPTIVSAGIITEVDHKDEPQSYISPDDIGALAAIILQEPIEKHKDAVYEMVGETITGDEVAAVVSKVLKRTIRYVQQSAEERYKMLVSYGFSHLAAYDLCGPMPCIPVTSRLPILLGRQPETLERYLEKYKAELI